MVVGDKKPYLISLLTVDSLVEDSLKEKLGISDSSLAESGTFQSYIQREIEKVNKKVAKFEKIGRFKFLANDFSVENGELTPTMKMKRKVVNQMYAKEIEEVYA